MRKDPPLQERRGGRPVHSLPRSPDRCPGSLALCLVTGPAPEAGPAPTAGPGAGPAAPAIPPGAAAGVGEGTGEQSHGLEAAHIEVIGVTVGHTVEVIPGVAHILAAGDPGQTPTTATPAGAAA